MNDFDIKNITNELAKNALKYPDLFNRTSSVLERHGTEWTIYSITTEIMFELDGYANSNLELSDVGMELMLLIKKANEDKSSVEAVRRQNEMEKRSKSRNKNRIENFFNKVKDKSFKSRLYVIMGETGVGKSYLVKQEIPDALFYACNEDMEADVFISAIVKDETHGIVPEETIFLQAMREGKVVVMDEMNKLPVSSLALIQGVTDEKDSVVIGSRVYKIHENFKILATMNPPSETDIRIPLGDALLGRAIGLVLSIDDKTILDRIGNGITQQFLNLVRQMFFYVRAAGLEDIRDLSFRDYKSFWEYDFAEQFKFKMCQGDVRNIMEYAKLEETGEFVDLLKRIEDEIENRKGE